MRPRMHRLKQIDFRDTEVRTFKTERHFNS